MDNLHLPLILCKDQAELDYIKSQLEPCEACGHRELVHEEVDPGGGRWSIFSACKVCECVRRNG